MAMTTTDLCKEWDFHSHSWNGNPIPGMIILDFIPTRISGMGMHSDFSRWNGNGNGKNTIPTKNILPQKFDKLVGDY